jgi:hypothetical protein
MLIIMGVVLWVWCLYFYSHLYPIDPPLEDTQTAEATFATTEVASTFTEVAEAAFTTFITTEASLSPSWPERAGEDSFTMGSLSSGTSPVVYTSVAAVVAVILVLAVLILVVMAVVYTRRKRRTMKLTR